MAGVEKTFPLISDDVRIQPSDNSDYSKVEKNYDSWKWKIVRYLHAEETGVERITEDMKTDLPVWTLGFMFFAFNFVYLSVSTGLNGVAAYGLTFWEAVLCIVLFNVISFLPVAYIATLGPEFGMRQMVISRFWVGYPVMRFFAALNACICTGWAILNLVSGASLLHALGHGALPPWAAILIMVACALVVTVLGYKVIQVFDRFAWIPTLIIMFIVIARMKISGTFSAGSFSGGSDEAGAVLSYGAAVVGSATSWILYMCDYTAYQKTNVSKARLFWVIYFSLLIGQIFLQTMGAAAATCMANSETYQDLYDELGIGGLMYGILVQDSLGRFGEFCIVLLALGLTTGNICCIYSASLSAQAVSSKFRLIPRFYWALLANLIAFGVAVACFYKFTEVMDNFMAMLGYFTCLYIGIFLSEHLIYRKYLGLGYNKDDYATASKLPLGFAAFFAFACGVAGATVGMYETWWTGPIAKLINEDLPGDVGFELSFAFSFIGHASSRWLELRYVGR